MIRAPSPLHPCPLGHFTTPLEPLNDLTRLLGGPRLWMQCHILLEDRTCNTTPDYTDNGNMLLDRLHGAPVERRPGGCDMQTTMEAVPATLQQQGRRPYLIPGGGSSPLGAIGYANAALELVQRATEQGLRIDTLVHATTWHAEHGTCWVCRESPREIRSRPVAIA